MAAFIRLRNKSRKTDDLCSSAGSLTNAMNVVDIFETDAEGKRRKVSCEIDFVINKGVKKYYIQSALSLGNAQKEKSELRPLLGVKDFFRKIIVTKSGMKPWLDEEGILHLGLYEFLLNPAALDL